MTLTDASPTGRFRQNRLSYREPFPDGLFHCSLATHHMARKVVNRKELRAEAEAAEARSEAAEEGAKGAKKTKAKAEKKAPAKRKSRSKTAEPERRKLFWGVFNQSAKRVALFDFSQRKAAEAKATELTSGGKNQHFVMKVKEAISE
jgi:hypothetical protein